MWIESLSLLSLHVLVTISPCQIGEMVSLLLPFSVSTIGTSTYLTAQAELSWLGAQVLLTLYAACLPDSLLPLFFIAYYAYHADSCPDPEHTQEQLSHQPLPVAPSQVFFPCVTEPDLSLHMPLCPGCLPHWSQCSWSSSPSSAVPISRMSAPLGPLQNWAFLLSSVLQGALNRHALIIGQPCLLFLQSSWREGNASHLSLSLTHMHRTQPSIQLVGAPQMFIPSLLLSVAGDTLWRQVMQMGRDAGGSFTGKVKTGARIRELPVQVGELNPH